MLKLLKDFFGANNKDSTPSEWTDESWTAASYEKMLATTAPPSIGSFGGDAGDGLFTGMFNDNEPRFNIDGTPMMGSVDIHGNPYGITGDQSGFDAYSHTDSGSNWSSGSDSFGSFDSGCSSDNHF